MTAVRIAMWSGPRNISTAMMRAWENRPDTAVSDEPLYGHYLLRTGLDHPGRDEVIAAQETDWRRVVAALAGPPPGGATVHYQKHMTHHMLPAIGRDWLDDVTSCFLIRDPAAVLASYVEQRPDVTLDDLGLPQQVDLFEDVRRRTGATPVVMEARDVLGNPRGMLMALCRAVGVAFAECMLSWPPGRRASDGVWGRYWYKSVEASTGFAPARPRPRPLAEHLRPLAQAAAPYYQALYAHRMAPEISDPESDPDRDSP